MTERIITDSNGRKHITNEPQLHPPQRTWVGLDDEDLANCSGHEVRWALYWEKLLKEKNNG